jgi:hypothetical protein
MSVLFSPEQMKLHVVAGGTDEISGLTGQDSYTTVGDADMLMTNQSQTGASTISIAVNSTYTVPGMTKKVVVSMLIKMDTPANGNSTMQALEFYVNRTPITGAEQAELLNSHFIGDALLKLLKEMKTNAKSAAAVVHAS